MNSEDIGNRNDTRTFNMDHLCCWQLMLLLNMDLTHFKLIKSKLFLTTFLLVVLIKLLMQIMLSTNRML